MAAEGNTAGTAVSGVEGEQVPVHLVWCGAHRFTSSLPSSDGS